MGQYSRIAKGSFTAASGQTSAIINLPFQPDFVEVWNLTNIGSAASAGNILRAYWDNNIPPYTPSGKSASQTMVEVYNSTPAVIYDTIYTNGVTGGTAPAGGISTFSNGFKLQFGPGQQIVGITKASQAVVNVTAHGYSVGDTVVMEGLFQTPTTGMAQIAGFYFTIVAVSDANHFTINWNTNQSNYTALSGSPSGSFVYKVLDPFNYLPAFTVPATITTGTTTTVSTAAYHNFEVGQQIAFRIPSSFGMTQLNSLPNPLIPGSPIYGYVTSVTDNWTFVCNINSTNFTAYNTNQSLTAVSTGQFPQVLSVGDVNTGGLINGLSSTNLYPSPQFPTFSNRVPTINGPAIRGAFVNNTSQGFAIGNGTPQEQGGSGTIVTSGSIIMWRAYLSDLASP